MRLAGVVAFALVMAGCTRHEVEPLSLWIPPGAVAPEGVKKYRSGSADLTFELTLRVTELDEVLQSLNQQAATLGWQRLETEWDRYGPPGWRTFQGGGVIRPGPPVETKHWHGVWQAADGARAEDRLSASRSAGDEAFAVIGYAPYEPAADR
ncbi:MAG: hypothetical protein IT178_02875 [Acidobacteria bacterium]|nr:hypothetical protein [Acidobacteriota bacterium]